MVVDVVVDVVMDVVVDVVVDIVANMIVVRLWWICNVTLRSPNTGELH